MERTKYKKRIRLKGFTYKGTYRYFLTLCTARGARPFTDARLVDSLVVILGEAASKSGFRVWTFCFMPDHLHLVVQGLGDDSDMRRFVSIFKQKSAFYYRQQAGEELWQENYYEHVLRRHEDTQTVVNYILMNPVRKGLVTEPKDYPFSGTLA